MNIVEKLDDKLVSQLASLYDKTWFTQDRNVEDIQNMLNNCYLILGFIESGELIGFCRVISDGIYKAFLFDVIVKNDYQNRGFGTLIIQTVLNHNRLVNVKHIELYCPEKMTHFYKKLGFQNRASILMRRTQ